MGNAAPATFCRLSDSAPPNPNSVSWRSTGPNSTGAYATGSPRRWYVLGVLCLGLTMVIVDETVLTVALPALRASLGSTTQDLQWVVAAFVVVSSGLLLPAGTLGDRYGRRLLLIVGLVVFFFGSLAAAFAASTSDLIVARAIGGVGAACIMPSTLSLLSSVFPPHERAFAIGVWSAVAGIGVMFAPLVGGWLLAHFWWGSIFLVNLPLLAVMLVATVALVPEVREQGGRRPDPVGALLASVALSATTLALIEAPTQHWASPSVGLAATVALAGAASFVAWERRSAAPMLDLRLFCNRIFRAPVLVITLVFAAWNGTGFVMTQAFQLARGLSPIGTALMFMPASLGWALASPFTARAVRRFGTRHALVGGLAVSGLSMACWATLVSSGPLWSIALLDGIGGAGIGVAITVATDLIIESVPRADAGIASGMNEVTRMVGVALGVSGFGSLLALLSNAPGGAEHALQTTPGHTAAAFGVGAALTVAACAAAILVTTAYAWWDLGEHGVGRRQIRNGDLQLSTAANPAG